MRQAYAFIRARCARARAKYKAAKTARAEASEGSGPVGEVPENGSESPLAGDSNAWADTMDGGGAGESLPDYDAFRKRYREFGLELEKPPASVRKLAAGWPACS